MKVTCLTDAFKSCMNNRAVSRPIDYEKIGYGTLDDDDNNDNRASLGTATLDWRHSTQVMDASLDEVPRHSRRTRVPDFDLYARTRTLLRQQTKSLIQHGYYYDEEEQSQLNSDHSSSSSSSSSSCSCSRLHSYTIATPTASMQLPTPPSSLVTSTFDDKAAADYSSNDKFYSIPPADDDSIDLSDSDADVYVCTYKFRSSIKGDLCLSLFERVKLVHASKSNEYFLVKSLLTHKCGYVPRFCLTPLSLTQFRE